MKNSKSIFKFLATIILIVFFTSVAKSQVCKPSFMGSGLTWGMYTANVTLDSINNSSTMPANSPYYTYYNTQSTTVNTGYGYWVKVTSGPNSTGYGNIAVWMDYNGNDTFETSEKIGEIDDIPGSALDSIYFNVPNNADSGQTKMRVIFSYYYKNITACQNLYYGECEDYNINIKYVACTSPPTAGTVITSNNNVCTNTPFLLSLQGSTLGGGQTYQWQKSADNTSWSNIGGALNMSLNYIQSDSTYYRCLLTCGGNTDSTQGLLIAQKPATNCYCHGKSYYPTLANIGNVTFGKFSNGSDTLPVDYNPNCKFGYSDFTNVGYIPLIRGNTYPLSITEICGGYYYSCDIYAWIDYNQNGEFESSEQIYNGSTTIGLYGNTIHKNIGIPTTVKTGVTGMRVKIAYFSSSNGVCDTAYYGESEDYNVYIYDQKSIDAYLYNIESPLAKSCYSNNESVKLGIYNSGTDTIMFANNNLTVHLDMSNMNTASLDSVIKSGYLAPATSMSVSLKGTLDMSKFPGNYDLNTYISLQNDSISYNDKIFRTLSPDIPVNTGYLVDFENYSAIPKTYINNGFAWSYGNGVNASSSLRTTILKTKYYTATSELIGPLTNLSAFKIYYKPSATMDKKDTVYIKISTDCGATFQTIYRILASNSNAFSFNSFQYDLGKYAGNNLIVKIITASNSTTSYFMDFDNFAVADKPQINIGHDTVVCDKITLYANPQHQSWDLQWSKYKATADTIVAKSSGIYWCTASDSIYGISNTDSVKIDVYATPSVSLGPDQILCLGNTLKLNPGSFVGYNFQWSTGDTSSTITVSKSGTYIVTVTAPAGCFGMDTIKITTLNKPSGSTITKGTPFDGKYNSGTFANPDDACAGNTLTYEVTPPTGYTNAQYSSNWFVTPSIQTIYGTAPIGKYNLTIPTATTNGNVNFMPDVADADSVYMITFTILDANTTCDFSVTRYLKVNAPPTVNLGSDQQVCPGDVVYWNTGANYPQYLWSNGSTSSLIAVSTPGSYWLKVTDSKGCSNFDTADLINFVPPAVNLGFDRGSCAGNAFILDAGNQSGYLWSTGANSQSIKVTKTGAYSVKVYSNDGCVASDTINIEILPKIKATFSYSKNTPASIKFTPDSTQYVTYDWDFGDSSASSSMSPFHAYNNDGSYTVKLKVIAKYGCSDSVTQTININTGINQVQTLANDISVFPNPYNHDANLNFTLTKNSNVNIELYDMYGRKINTLANAQMAEGKHNMLIITHGTAQAVYILRMLVDGQSTIIRLVDLGND